MPYLDSLPEDAGPPAIFKRHPEIYGPFSQMSEAMMNGPSELSQAEREVVLAYAAGVAGCGFVLTGHSEVAYVRGVERGLLDALLRDLETAPCDDRLRALLRFVRTLSVTPNDLGPADAEAVRAAGWGEEALHRAIAVTARAAFMHRLVAGCGFAPLDPGVARSHAAKRVERGYVNLYRAFRAPPES